MAKPIIKFRAIDLGTPRIEEIKVISETAHFITTAGRFGGNGVREKKEKDWSLIADSFDDAKSWLYSRAEQEIKSARRRLELANSKLGNIKGIKPIAMSTPNKGESK